MGGEGGAVMRSASSGSFMGRVRAHAIMPSFPDSMVWGRQVSFSRACSTSAVPPPLCFCHPLWAGEPPDHPHSHLMGS